MCNWPLASNRFVDAGLKCLDINIWWQVAIIEATKRSQQSILINLVKMIQTGWGTSQHENNSMDHFLGTSSIFKRKNKMIAFMIYFLSNAVGSWKKDVMN